MNDLDKYETLKSIEKLFESYHKHYLLPQRIDSLEEGIPDDLTDALRDSCWNFDT